MVVEQPIAEISPYVRPVFWGWVDSEFLVYWVKSGPLPVALVTTTNTPGTPLSGALGAPGTQVLYGGTANSFGAFSGLRLSAGCWQDADQSAGLELRGFFLERRSSTFSAASDGSGNPPLYLSAYNPILGGERALVVADPVAQFAGGVQIDYKTQLMGAELNYLAKLYASDLVRVNLIVGLRHLDLRESLEIQNLTTDLVLGTVDRLTDQFGTHNHFYGGQVGLNVGHEDGPWSYQLTGKLGVGVTAQEVDVNGNSSETGTYAASPGDFVGGFYAQPSNGRQSQITRFTLVPEIEARLGYDVTAWLRVSVSYNALYWSSVVRPGNEIDRNLNLNQSGLFAPPTANTFIPYNPATGPFSPGPLLNHTTFWAQGVGLNLEFRY